MSSFSQTLTDLTGIGLYYLRSPQSASYFFNQNGLTLYTNHPRFPFEYYVTFTLNNVGTAQQYINSYFNSPELTQLEPLVKEVVMPSMTIDNTALNQYNRHRISQSKITFKPVKMKFHDVVDGKSLKFWEMYYRYYFKDGNEPGINSPIQSQPQQPQSIETLLHNITPQINPNILNLPSSITNLFNNNAQATPLLPTNTVGVKSATDNIISNTLNNQNFGFNLEQVGNVRDLIRSINIFQIHGGRYNMVTLVNPKVKDFSHDTLAYHDRDRTLEITLTFDYEYAYYTIQNAIIGDSNLSTEPFNHAQQLELPALAFNTVLMEFVQSNNPLLNSPNPILQNVGQNVQNQLGSLTGSILSNSVQSVTGSALDGLANISPKPTYINGNASIVSRSFAQTATSSSLYQDVNRIASF